MQPPYYRVSFNVYKMEKHTDRVTRQPLSFLEASSNFDGLRQQDEHHHELFPHLTASTRDRRQQGLRRSCVERRRLWLLSSEPCLKKIFLRLWEGGYREIQGDIDILGGPRISHDSI